MARIRTIKPEFPQSESMGRVSRDARLLFIMLWTIADDSGRLRGNSRMLASLLFPYDDDAGELIDGWLAELERESSIVLYSVQNHAYLQICNWLIHQKIDKPSQSKIPEFNESSRILANPREHSSEDQGPKDQRTKDLIPPLSPKGEKRKSDKFDLSTLVYPAPLDTPKWEEWLENRKTLGKRVTLIAAKKQLAFLAGYTLEQQRIIIDQSIMNGYTGLFPPKGGFNGQAGSGSGSHPRPDNSAAGRVRANIARDRAADAARAGQMAMANDELHVRPQMDEQLRGRSGPGQGMGLLFEGDFERSD